MLERLTKDTRQALPESAVQNPESGKILAGYFLDYSVPQADGLSDFEGELGEAQLGTHNPLGVKGCGEFSNIGSPAAFVSLILNALGLLGVTGIEMSLTPQRVCDAIRKAEFA